MQLILSAPLHPPLRVIADCRSDLMRLAWPVILQWRRELSKVPACELRLEFGPHNLGWVVPMNKIKKDGLDTFLFNAAQHS